MPYLVKADFKTHLYDEITDAITRADDSIVSEAINTAISEAKSYLSRFNLLQLFGNDATAATVTDLNLKNKVKDMASWYIVRLANPNINMELMRTLYEDALKWLKDVQKGNADPEGWPYKDDNADTAFNENNFVQFSTNTKRDNHY